MTSGARIVRGTGGTPTETYLQKLCERTFLRLWSYPRIFRDQGSGSGRDGKEICDLLVVCGTHILIFSDKQIAFPSDGPLELRWQRWFRRAVLKSAEQARGAQRWITDYPARIFLDAKCQHRLPLDLPPKADAQFHLIVVAHGVAAAVRRHFGDSGTGSLLIDTDIRGEAAHRIPFVVGDIDPGRSFVHVFDDDSLQTVMGTLDTISDFVHFLEKRELLFRGALKVSATGEEELLSFYLSKLNAQNEHDFVFDASQQGLAGITILEGHWKRFCVNPQRLAQIKADQISYFWDRLIERFSGHALAGDQHYVTDGGIKDSETILRFMAREPRFARRYLAHAFLDLYGKTAKNIRALRILQSPTQPGLYYVVLLLPVPPPAWNATYEDYRIVRRNFLYSSLLAAKLERPDALDIVGIATESGPNSNGESEDAGYFDTRHWSEDLRRDAEERKDSLRLLQNTHQVRISFKEYPDVPRASTKKPRRNSACPCGSGRKYKKCCFLR
ncbi:hypothetical protein FHP25_25105 [Vineibacter terrae]|uniref:Preprotein translocase subunit SecA n=1 Tax=Vineibacter terrae TaxID=2586908 RepID=A0A5C8PFK0_9HYPH|nr:SEC-C metal-binding domain-containing protein [Vineibacter terrae]TXL72578.1 hypothetical protein FHP25_25105 [Vineibacter terrae]